MFERLVTAKNGNFIGVSARCFLQAWVLMRTIMSRAARHVRFPLSKYIASQLVTLSWQFVKVESKGRRSEVSLTQQGKSALRIFGSGT